MSAAFEKAVADSKKLTSKPSNDDLLEIYGASRPVTSHSHTLSCARSTIIKQPRTMLPISLARDQKELELQPNKTQRPRARQQLANILSLVITQLSTRSLPAPTSPRLTSLACST